MKLHSSVLAAALALACSASAPAHENHAKHQAAEAKGTVQVPVPSAQPQPLKPKRDPAAYFTDRELLTQDGRKVRFYSDVLKGRMVVLSTMYTNCEEACPLITEQLKKISEHLGDQLGKGIFFVAISSDPARDTPSALNAYAARHKTVGPGWIYLTGKKPDVDTILKKLGAWSEHIEAHSTQLIAWNFNTDRGRKMLPSMPPEAIAQQIKFLASDEASPLSAGGAGAPAAAKVN